MNKKRIWLLAVFLCLTVCITGVFAAAESEGEELSVGTEESETSETSVPEVRLYVTIADDQGALVLAYEEIMVGDADGDGALTVNDAMICTHNAKFEGGADAGYASETTTYGLSMTKLWGVSNGGSYGYYVNHTAAYSLLDPVVEGDLVNAFIYTDLESWSDAYCYFDVDHVSVVGDDTLTLTLVACGYDAEWNPVTFPVAGATILIDGKETSFVTDDDGKVTLQFDGTGYCIVSAKKEGVALVPPVCAVAVSSNQPAAGDHFSLLLWFGLAAVALSVLVALRARTRRADTV